MRSLTFANPLINFVFLQPPTTILKLEAILFISRFKCSVTLLIIHPERVAHLNIFHTFPTILIYENLLNVDIILNKIFNVKKNIFKNNINQMSSFF